MLQCQVLVWAQFCQVSGGTTSLAVRIVALDNKDVLAAAGNDLGDLIKLRIGQCHHDFEINVPSLEHNPRRRPQNGPS